MIKSLCVIYLSIYLANCLYPWAHKNHRNIVYQASKLNCYPDDFRKLLRKYNSALIIGSTLPDEEDPQEIRAHNPKAADTMINQLAGSLLDKELNTDFFKDLGRICHYISDINQPMHTDDSEEEGDDFEGVHKRYEDAARDIEIEQVKIKKCNYIKSYSKFVDIVAEQSNKYYEQLVDHFYCAPNARIKGDIYKITIQQLKKSVKDTADIWFTIWKNREIKSLKKQLKSPADYVKLIDMYCQVSLSKKAKKVCKQALKKYPDDKQLKAKFGKLDKE